MAKWEYIFLKIPAHPNNFNEWGGQGWEYVECYAKDASHLKNDVYLFKRKLKKNKQAKVEDIKQNEAMRVAGGLDVFVHCYGHTVSEYWREQFVRAASLLKKSEQHG